MPWFCRTLPQEVSEDIEVHLCPDEGISHEEVYLEPLEGTYSEHAFPNL